MATNEMILEEIESLQAILMDDINVNYTDCGEPCDIEITLKPATGQNVEKQHVRVTLAADISQGYPDVPPVIMFRNPRGIDEEVLLHIENGVKKKCQEFLGFPVIYELTELVRESLTANNAPKCPCAICLFHFSSNDSFTKTECFHYYHSHCLGRYIENCNAIAAIQQAEEDLQPTWVERKKKEILCPVCRDVLTQVFNCVELLMHPEAEDSNNLKDFSDDPEIRALQAKMAALFQHQKSKGGIIDLEEERTRFLITSTPETDQSSPEASEQDKSTNESVSNQSAKSTKNTKSVQKCQKQLLDGTKKVAGSNHHRNTCTSNKSFPSTTRSTRRPANNNQPVTNRATRPIPDSRRGRGRTNARPPPGFRPLQSENGPQSSS